ncbi:MAG TPA: hypothetical protein VFV38_37680 [Ktedonobacteraceae bacterium]|nr:hypothetical protein [Ktedonobacteraceae bacterium]
MQYPPNQSNSSSPNDPTIPGQFYPIAPPPPPPGARHKRLWRWYRAQRKRTQWGLGCGIITAAFFLCICSAAFAATPGTGQPQTASAPTPTATATTVALVATTPPTATPTPRPTPTPTPKPTPTPNPCANAVNGNPWCYDFSPGNLIYSPPAGFCGYFNCISSFWSGSGFVNECNDGTYSKSGGHRGDCSHYGGEQQPLYSH